MTTISILSDEDKKLLDSIELTAGRKRFMYHESFSRTQYVWETKPWDKLGFPPGDLHEACKCAGVQCSIEGFSKPFTTDKHIVSYDRLAAIRNGKKIARYHYPATSQFLAPETLHETAWWYRDYLLPAGWYPAGTWDVEQFVVFNNYIYPRRAMMNTRYCFMCRGTRSRTPYGVDWASQYRNGIALCESCYLDIHLPIHPAMNGDA